MESKNRVPDTKQRTCCVAHALESAKHAQHTHSAQAQTTQAQHAMRDTHLLRKRLGRGVFLELLERHRLTSFCCFVCLEQVHVELTRSKTNPKPTNAASTNTHGAARQPV